MMTLPKGSMTCSPGVSGSLCNVHQICGTSERVRRCGGAACVFWGGRSVRGRGWRGARQTDVVVCDAEFRGFHGAKTRWEQDDYQQGRNPAQRQAGNRAEVIAAFSHGWSRGRERGEVEGEEGRGPGGGGEQGRPRVGAGTCREERGGDSRGAGSRRTV